jgi:hypothetical protein
MNYHHTGAAPLQRIEDKARAGVVPKAAEGMGLRGYGKG